MCGLGLTANLDGEVEKGQEETSEVDQAVQTSPIVSINNGMIHSGATASTQDELTGRPMKSNCGLWARWGSILHI